MVRYYIHRIGSGDTFYALAAHYDVSVEMIEGANPRLNPTLLRVGDEVLIPALKEVEPYRPSKTEDVVFTDVYTVQKGDSLWGLSRKYGVSPESLARNNGLELDGVLREGVLLQVP